MGESEPRPVVKSVTPLDRSFRGPPAVRRGLFGVFGSHEASKDLVPGLSCDRWRKGPSVFFANSPTSLFRGAADDLAGGPAKEANR